ncbi:MAG: DUF2764 family protein [Bacteroidales bacterium]|nr:DUF2764 family protein [Bacteroidales bacterium]
MNNYHYIIASLPVLSKGGEDRSFNLAKIKEEIAAQCSEKDVEAINFFCRLFEDSNLDREYFLKASQSQSRFTRLYSKLDRQIRNMMVSSAAHRLYSPEKAEELSQRYQIDILPDPYGDYVEPADTEADLVASDRQALTSLFAEENIVTKEKRLDEFKWDKINSFTTLDFFNIDCILAFLAKGYLVSRWLKLDAGEGKHLFRKLVAEVRGTFDKHKLKYTIDENNG